MPGPRRPSHRRVSRWTEDLFAEGMHAKRVLSLAAAVTGLLASARVGISAIGLAYARLAGIQAQSGITQVDRLVGNAALRLNELLRVWVRFVIGTRTEMIVALDWTEFADDDQATLCAYQVSRHGRATPLGWKTVKKSALKNRRNAIEYALIDQLHSYVPDAVRITLLADRGFGDQKLYRFVETLGWDYVIRFRGRIAVEVEGESKPASAWVLTSGRARKLAAAKVTAAKATVPAVVVVHDKKMKEPWCLATTLVEQSAAEVVALYGRRFCIEETFRDTKDLHFGMGLSATHVGSSDRRDRLLLVVALALAFLTLLGAAGEAAGLGHHFGKKKGLDRVYSLFRQGLYWYQALPDLPPKWRQPLVEHFDALLREQPFVKTLVGTLLNEWMTQMPCLNNHARNRLLRRGHRYGFKQGTAVPAAVSGLQQPGRSERPSRLPLS